jgi:Sugar transferases involved in lipopolysaccharide synthesis
MQRFLKRVLDLVIAIAGLIFCALPWLVIAVLIKLDSKGPVFFLQERAGKDNKPFMIYKFRTMTVGADKEGFYTGEGDARITTVGNFLRKTSFDELPQLINIFLGEMSVVGPRPTLLYQTAEYDEHQKKRLLVPPGVTGWAQVNGRNSLTWPQRIEFDVWYVEHWSLWLDIKIFLMTFGVWAKGEGVYAPKENFVVNEGDEEKL